jgi:hypothetical protein
MFGLTERDLAQGVLDCGGGPASFTAEAYASGHATVAVDPIYAYSGAEIRSRFDATAEFMLQQVRATPDDWVWGYHCNPEDLLANRRAAIERFLVDYEPPLRHTRYIVGELPCLPFAAGAFGLVLCSHLLFLYSDLLSESFHIASVGELCRVGREVRIFPLLTNGGEPSPHLPAVRRAIAGRGWRSEIVRVPYELQRRGNQMLRIYRERHQ